MRWSSHSGTKRLVILLEQAVLVHAEGLLTLFEFVLPGSITGLDDGPLLPDLQNGDKKRRAEGKRVGLLSLWQRSPLASCTHLWFLQEASELLKVAQMTYMCRYEKIPEGKSKNQLKKSSKPTSCYFLGPFFPSPLPHDTRCSRARDASTPAFRPWSSEFLCFSLFAFLHLFAPQGLLKEFVWLIATCRQDSK